MGEPTVTLHGNPLALAGTSVSVGDQAPNVELLDNELNPVSLSSLRGKTLVLL